MRFQFEFDRLPVGYSASAARKADDEVSVITRSFISIDSGELYFQVLKGISNAYVSKIPIEQRMRESTIDNLIAVVYPDKKCHLLVNELSGVARCRVRGKIGKGDPVFEGNLLGIESLAVPDIEVPGDAGLMVLVSHQWRKAVYFDYGPLLQKAEVVERPDLDKLMGAMTSWLMFRDRVRFSELEWNEIFGQSWFPFVTLSSSTIDKMRSFASNRWDIDGLMDEIEGDVSIRIEGLRESIQHSDVAVNHRQVLDCAIRHFLNHDYISCVSILYPRIEGLLRECVKWQGGASFRSGELAAVPGLLSNMSGNDSTILMPDRFGEYLKSVYFSSFDPHAPDVISRHSVSHGVAPEDKLDRKAALLSVLILEHLVYLAVKPRTS